MRSFDKKVLSFFGYSGMGYEDEVAMLDAAGRILETYSTDSTVVNIGATSVGLGRIYPLAKSMGFTTTGIVSTRAIAYLDDISTDVDHVLFIRDELWGGYLEGTETLSPTSEAMVSSSDQCVAFGGNEISRDELLVARKRGIPVLFIPADSNHAKTITRMTRQGLPRPTSFEGEAHRVFGQGEQDANQSDYSGHG